jgi:predicted MFS family arabinose efflux permease
MGAKSGLAPILRALRNRNYAAYTAGNSISLIGSWTQRVAVFWLAWELSESTAWLGAIAFADLFPVVIFSPLAGAAADRWDRLRASQILSTLLMINAWALFALTYSGLITIHILFALILFDGTVVSFSHPNRQALVPSLVPKESLPTAIAFNAVQFNLARFVGPAVAGAIIVGAGTPTAFAFNAVSYLVIIAVLTRLKLAGTKGGRTSEGGLLGEIGAGFSYAAQHPGMAPLFLLFGAGSLLCRPFTELLAGFAAEVFGGGAETLAMFTSAMGLGAVAGAFYLAGRAGTGGLTRIVLTHSILLPVAVLLFTATDVFIVAIAALVLAGVSFIVGAIGTQTLLQLRIPAAMRGRVLGLHITLFRGGPAVGALLIGSVSELVGLRVPLAIGSALTILAGLWAWRRRDVIAASLEGAPTDHLPQDDKRQDK